MTHVDADEPRELSALLAAGHPLDIDYAISIIVARRRTRCVPSCELTGARAGIPLSNVSASTLRLLAPMSVQSPRGPTHSVVGGEPP